MKQVEKVNVDCAVKGYSSSIRFSPFQRKNNHMKRQLDHSVTKDSQTLLNHTKNDTKKSSRNHFRWCVSLTTLQNYKITIRLKIEKKQKRSFLSSLQCSSGTS